MQSTVNGGSIKTIIEMDKKAREKVADAKQQAERINAEAEEEKKKLLCEYNTNYKNRLEAEEQTCRSEAEAKIKEIQAKRDKKIADFDKILNDNRDSLMDSIFEAVTGSKRRH